jgi:hypothetical protein
MGDYRWWESFSIGRLQVIFAWYQFVLFAAYTWYGIGPEYDNPVYREVVILSVRFRWWCEPTFELTSTE